MKKHLLGAAALTAIALAPAAQAQLLSGSGLGQVTGSVGSVTHGTTGTLRSTTRGTNGTTSFKTNTNDSQSRLTMMRYSVNHTVIEQARAFLDKTDTSVANC